MEIDRQSLSTKPSSLLVGVIGREQASTLPCFNLSQPGSIQQSPTCMEPGVGGRLGQESRLPAAGKSLPSQANRRAVDQWKRRFSEPTGRQAWGATCLEAGRRNRTAGSRITSALKFVTLVKSLSGANAVGHSLHHQLARLRPVGPLVLWSDWRGDVPRPR